MKKAYNKLVRDRIPEIIKKNGDTYVIRKLTVKEFKCELLKKLLEEAREVESSKETGELVKEIADLKEVLLAIEKTFRLNPKIIEKIRKERNKSRGGFEKRIFLESTF